MIANDPTDEDRNPMLDLVNRRELGWPTELRPIGNGSHDKEPFASWWARNALRLANLGPRVAEQWIYRHWDESPFQFLPLEPLHATSERWSSDVLLATVHIEFGGPVDPEHDYRSFSGNGTDPLSTALNWHQGSWTIPIVVLRTPQGIRTHGGDRPDIRFLLIEGSKRVRWLHALHFRRAPTGPHLVHVLELVSG